MTHASLGLVMSALVCFFFAFSVCNAKLIAVLNVLELKSTW
jgi:hypothetical protein